VARESKSFVQNFDSEEEYSRLPLIATTRGKVRDSEVCRPEQLPKQRVYSGSRYSQDPEPNDNQDSHDGSQDVVGYEDYESESGDEYSDDDEDPDEFAAEQADEADQYFRR
jgi:hypothetical protein